MLIDGQVSASKTISEIRRTGHSRVDLAGIIATLPKNRGRPSEPDGQGGILRDLKIALAGWPRRFQRTTA
jgi:hypothetical protein